MSVPDYESLMLPLLRYAGDGAEHKLSEAVETLAREFDLTDADRREMLPSGQQPKFENRVGWARTYLKKAGLLATPVRARMVITDRGRDVLRRAPVRIDDAFLAQFEEFRVFQTRSATASGTAATALAESPALTVAVSAPTDTPEERLELAYEQLRQNLADELLDRVRRCSPSFFERLVVDLLVSMGYGGSRTDAGQAVGQSGDGGIDGIIKEDRLGLDAVYVQAKRWDAKVGRPVVQAFAGSLEGMRARKGILITTSDFSAEARDYVGRIEKKIVLIDGVQLADLMLEHGVGVTAVRSYDLKRLDADYFIEE
jgi:restriction system protein